MRIAFYELEEWEKEIVSTKLGQHELHFCERPLSAQNTEDVEAIAVFIYSDASAEILSQMPDLKLIATMSTGFDHIDLAYCRARGIAVCNVPIYGENTVAEHTMALMLALSRKLFPSIKRTHEQHEFHTDESLRGFDLKGKTLGVIGTGSIGRHVIRMARGFDMEVLSFDAFPKEGMDKELGFSYTGLEELLRGSDIVTLHVPHNEHTHHMISHDQVEFMKDGAIIINTSRGPLINTDALLRGLESGKVGGAGLDVLECESSIDEEISLLKQSEIKLVLEDNALMKRENVIITPHNAFNSREALIRIINTTTDNIEKFMEGRLQNEVH